MEFLTFAIALAAVGLASIALVAARRRPAPDIVAVSAPELPTQLREGLATALRHVSVVRYDAFSDVSGRQSFTAAILDDNGDGIVITSLHSRAEARTMLKGVEAGRGVDLSPEEQQAVDHARGSLR